MRHALFLLVLGQVLALSACSGPAPPKHPLLQSRQTGCDDGGSGGVVIDGVCL
ncbi:hypothetical protein [Amaricoccus solimangrovi]|uniref:hypothetical protein n=1 Tax=Amaricoccus solimangrovi TaxID=2589815 RepID=UPI0015E31DAF|nr:hypothetical protein [Amaricoccus solimangrovi]